MQLGIGKVLVAVAAGSKYVTAEALAVLAADFRGKPVGYTNGPVDPAVSPGIARTTADEYRKALAADGIYTEASAKPTTTARDAKGKAAGPHTWTLTVISAEDFADRKAKREAARQARIDALAAAEAAEAEAEADEDVEEVLDGLEEDAD